MASNNEIKNKIVLEGEAEYKKQLAQINRELKESKAAMKAAAAEYESSGGSMASMQEQGDALERTIRSQEEALQLMGDQLKKVEKNYGENSRQAVELRTRINNMRTELAKSKTQLKEFESGLENSADAGNDLEQQLGGANNTFAQVGEAANDALQDVNSLSQGIANAVGEKLISFKIAEKALDAAKEAISFAIGEAVQGSVEDGLMLALTGDEGLSEARSAVKDEVDKRWAGRLSGEETTGIVASADTALGNVAGSDPELVTAVSNAAILQQEVFGGNAAQQIEYAKNVVNTYGTAWGTVFDLMTKGYQDSSDGGTLMNSVLDKSVNLFEQMGYDADDMFAVVLNAVNNETLGKDNNLNSGMTALVTNVQDGSEALKTLGFETTEMAYKVQQGGATAALAYQDVLTALLSIEDIDLKNQLGEELFGETVWTATGGGIAQALLDGFGQTIEADGATQAAMDALLNNVEDSAAGAKERVSQAAEEAISPAVEVWNQTLQGFNSGWDKGGALEGVINGVKSGTATMATEISDAIADGMDPQKTKAKWIDLMRESAEAAGDAWSESYTGEITEAVNDSPYFIPNLTGEATEAAQDSAAAAADTVGKSYLERLSEVLSNPHGVVEAEAPSIDDLLSTSSQPAGEGSTVLASDLQAQIDEAASAALQAVKDSDQTLTIDDLFTARAEAAESGDYELVQQLNLVIEQVIEAMKTGGEDAGQALIDGWVGKESDTSDAAQATGEAAAEALESTSGDMSNAGEDLGGAGVSGAETGLDGMYGAGTDGAAGVVAGLYTGVDGARSAGHAVGRAFEEAYRDELDTHSPSRVMEDAAHDTTAGLFRGFDADSVELQRRAAGLGEAVAEGYGEGAQLSASFGGAAPAEGIDYARIGQEVAQAISGMVLGMDARRAGDLLEIYVSRAQNSRAESTTQGMSTRVKGW